MIGGKRIIKILMIEESIDILLAYIYKEGNASCEVSKLLTSKYFNYSSSYIICQKIDELGLFEVLKLNTEEEGANSFLRPNLKGFEFVEKYGSYSNYLLEQKKLEEKETNKELWSIKSAMGDYYGGIYLAIIAIFISLYQCNENKEKDITIQKLQYKIDSIERNRPPKFERQLPKQFHIKNPK